MREEGPEIRGRGGSEDSAGSALSYLHPPSAADVAWERVPLGSVTLSAVIMGLPGKLLTRPEH